MRIIFDEDEKIFNTMRVGADGYLLKDEPVEKIWEALDHVKCDQGAPMSPGIARKVLNLISRQGQKYAASCMLRPGCRQPGW